LICALIFFPEINSLTYFPFHYSLMGGYKISTIPV